MPRHPRNVVGGVIYHVLNRANGRQRIFSKRGDYEAFERVLVEAHERLPIRIIDYTVMPNHWHFVLWPEQDDQVTSFMGWLSMTHTQRWHAAHDTTGTGHLYQGRFKDFAVQSDKHLLTVCRYVDRNTVRSGLVKRAEQWPYSALYHRAQDGAMAHDLLSDGPMPLPDNWLEIVNERQSSDEEDALRLCIRRGRPFGTTAWVSDTAKCLGRDFTLRAPGRPFGSVKKPK